MRVVLTRNPGGIEHKSKAKRLRDSKSEAIGPWGQREIRAIKRKMERTLKYVPMGACFRAMYNDVQSS